MKQQVASPNPSNIGQTKRTILTYSWSRGLYTNNFPGILTKLKTREPSEQLIRKNDLYIGTVGCVGLALCFIAGVVETPYALLVEAPSDILNWIHSKSRKE
jgi:hypothetical protein